MLISYLLRELIFIYYCRQTSLKMFNHSPQVAAAVCYRNTQSTELGVRSDSRVCGCVWGEYIPSQETQDQQPVCSRLCQHPEPEAIPSHVFQPNFKRFC